MPRPAPIGENSGFDAGPPMTLSPDSARAAACEPESPAVVHPARRTLANALRALAMDAVEQAQSGHPGMPLGMADIAEVLWRDYLRHDPADPAWWDRDRFVLSNGHGSMLLYGLLHLSGYHLPLDELRRFRQLHSQTPGHPEYGHAPGVETTTGPLGQGLANAVGMALAEKLLAARYNRDGFPLIDHYTYVFAGDGCLMEGISHEVCSLAGTLGLGKLICFYDDNGISIDGKVEGWFTDATPARFRAYGWQVIEAVDGHDAPAIAAAIDQARAETAKPTLICCRTIIGYGAPHKQGSAETHGAPLGAAEVAAARAELGWPYPPFTIPDEIRAAWDARERGAAHRARWQQCWDEYRQAYPEPAAEIAARMQGEVPAGWAAALDQAIADFQRAAKNVASRKASQLALEVIGPHLAGLIGGSADLTGSNNTLWSGSVDCRPDLARGNYLYFGVREFGMTAIANGLALHGGFIPYTGTFLVFSDYARSAVRLSALLPARVIHVYTHDSIGLGEDGPTHQPVEQLASLRLIPNLAVWRPCDAVETLVAWRAAIERRSGPSALILSRQTLPHQTRDAAQLAAIARGGYVLKYETGERLEVILLATGSEVAPAVEAQGLLAADGIAARVVSLPNVERFAEQDAAYRDSVLPPGVKARVAIEAGAGALWHRWAGEDGAIVALDRFGASAPGEVLMKEFGFTAGHIAAEARRVLAALKEQRS